MARRKTPNSTSTTSTVVLPDGMSEEMFEALQRGDPFAAGIGMGVDWFGSPVAVNFAEAFAAAQFSGNRIIRVRASDRAGLVAAMKIPGAAIEIVPNDANVDVLNPQFAIHKGQGPPTPADLKKK